MIVTSVQIKTAKTQKHLYCPVFTKNLLNSQEFGRFFVFFEAIKKIPIPQNSTLIQLAFKSSRLFQKDISQDIGIPLVCFRDYMAVNVAGRRNLSVPQPLGDRHRIDAVEIEQ